MKQKRYFNKFNTGFKNSPHQKQTKQKPQNRMLFSWLELKLNQAVNFCKIDSGLSFMLNIRCFTGEMAKELAIVVSHAMKVKKGIPQRSFS